MLTTPSSGLKTSCSYDRRRSKLLRYFVTFTKAIETRRLTMGVADGRVEADGEVIYLVKDMKVALSVA